MDDERDKILRMIANGSISAEEGQTLLDAIEPNPIPGNGRWHPPQDEPLDLPDMTPYRKKWQSYFNNALGISAGSMALFMLLRKRLGVFGFLLRLLLLPTALLSGVIALASYWSRDGLWLLVRVFSGDKLDVEISMPVPIPLHWLRTVVGMAQDIVPVPEISDQLTAASTYLDEIGDNPDRDPFVVDVDDGDGNRVQVFVG